MLETIGCPPENIKKFTPTPDIDEAPSPGGLNKGVLVEAFGQDVEPEEKRVCGHP